MDVLGAKASPGTRKAQNSWVLRMRINRIGTLRGRKTRINWQWDVWLSPATRQFQEPLLSKKSR